MLSATQIGLSFQRLQQHSVESVSEKAKDFVANLTCTWRETSSAFEEGGGRKKERQKEDGESRRRRIEETSLQNQIRAALEARRGEREANKKGLIAGVSGVRRGYRKLPLKILPAN